MPAKRSTTERELRDWRTGQVFAERLAAAVLLLEGFEGVDPQAPLGGPDGRKDILCNLAGHTYVAAVYFPLNDKSFGEIEVKFTADLDGPVRHSRDGIVFITNQHIGLTDRQALETLAVTKGKECILYHRERIRAVLDSPVGYGVRLEFLGIAMSEEEQLA